MKFSGFYGTWYLYLTYSDRKFGWSVCPGFASLGTSR